MSDLRKIVYKTLSDEATFIVGNNVKSIKVCSFESGHPFAIEAFLDITLANASTVKLSLEVSSDDKYFIKECTNNLSLSFDINENALFVKTDNASPFTSIKARKEIKYGYIDNPTIVAATPTSPTWTAINVTTEENLVKNLKVASTLNANVLNTTGATSLGTTLNVTGITTLSNALNVTGLATLSNDLNINGGDLNSNQTTFNLLNNTVTTLNLGAALTTLNLMSTSGTVNINSLTESTSYTNGALVIDGGLGIAKRLNVQGNIDGNGTLDILGTSILRSTLNVIGATDLDSTLNVDGISTFNQDILVKNDAKTLNTFTLDNNTGNIVTNGTLTVDSIADFNTTNITFSKDLISSKDIQGANATFTGNLNIQGNSTLGNAGTDTLNITGITNLTGPLTVSGLTSLNNQLNLDGILNVRDSSNIVKYSIDNITGNTIIHGTLNTKLNVDFDSNLNVDGNTTLVGTLNVDGAVDIDNTLDVLLGTTLRSTLGVTGISTLSSLLNANGGIAINTNNFKVATTGTTELNSTGSVASLLINNSGNIARDAIRITSGSNSVKFTVDGVTGNVLGEGDFRFNGSGILGNDSSNDLLTINAKPTINGLTTINAPTTIVDSTFTIDNSLNTNGFIMTKDGVGTITGQLSIDDLLLNGNTISSLNANKIVIDPINGLLDIDANITLTGNDRTLTYNNSLKVNNGVNDKWTINSVGSFLGSNGDKVISNTSKMTMSTSSGDIELNPNGVLSIIKNIKHTTGRTDSLVVDGASAKGFILNTPSYTTAGAKLLSVNNNNVEKFSIDKDGDVYIAGDLTVAGDNFTVNVGTMTVEDKNVVINSAGADRVSADGAGIIIESGVSDISLLWNNTNERMIFNTDLEVQDDIYAKTLTLSNAGLSALSVTGSSTLNGDTTINNLDVNQAFTVNGGDVITSGTLSAGSMIINNVLTVDGITNFDSILDVTGATTLGGALSIIGNYLTTINNTLTIDGVTNFDNILTTTGAVNLGGGLDIVGAYLTTINNTLTVTGATNLNSALDVAGSTNLGGNLTVSGNNLTLLNDSLQVDGPTIITDALTIGSVGTPRDFTTGGDLIANQSTNIDGALTIGGDMIVTGNFDLTNSGGTSFNLNTTLLTNGVFESKVLDNVSPQTAFQFNMETALTDSDSTVISVHNGTKEVFNIGNDGLIDFDRFQITNNDTNLHIRTAWTADATPRQILRVPELYIDGETYIENTQFGTILTTPADINSTALTVIPIGDTISNFNLYGSGNIETNGTVSFINASGQVQSTSIMSFNDTDDRWEINSIDIILEGDTLVGGTY